MQISTMSIGNSKTTFLITKYTEKSIHAGIDNLLALFTERPCKCGTPSQQRQCCRCATLFMGEWEGKYAIEKIKMTGFLAQEVEQAALLSGYDFSGIQKPENPEDLYSLRYSDFVMPLVKAVQELNAQNQPQQTQLHDQQQAIESLQQQNESLQSQLDDIKHRLGMH